MPTVSVSSPSSPPRATDSIVKAELIKMVIDGTLISTGSGMLGAIFTTAVFTWLSGGNGNISAAWSWCAVMIMTLAPGQWIVSHGKKIREHPGQLLRFNTTLIVYSGCIGVTYGATSWLLLPAGSPAAEAFLIMSMAMVLMVGSPPHRAMLLAFTMSFATVFSAGLARFDDRYHVAFAMIFAACAGIAILFARNQEVAVRRQMLSNLENQQLRTLAEAERGRADSASHAKSAFLAAASHGLRQPLHALVQYSAHLNRANHNRALDDTVRCISFSVDAMHNLLDSALDLSSSMMGGVQPVLTAFPIDSLLERLDAQLRPLATTKGLQLIVNRGGASVTSDSVLLERILRNLITNAISYTDHGNVTVRCRLRRDQLQVQISDTGIGIPREAASRIFDPFYQVEKDTREPRKGMGLGLAIVQRLCDLLGHRLRFKTRVGRGTVFVVSVPVSGDTAPVQPGRPSDESLKDYVCGAVVLLIDDDELSRDASEHTLRAFGCRVISVASTHEAIEQLQSQELAPQLIVTEYRLEGTTGIEAIQAVTRSLPLLPGESSRVPALVMSGDTRPEELRRVNDHGYPMLHKPVTSEDLWYALNRLLEREEQASGQ